MQASERFEDVRDELCARRPEAARTQMMGHPSIKADGRLVACYVPAEDAIAFKLEQAETHAEALALPGSHLFDPRGGRPMRQWVVVPARHAQRWLDLAERAIDRA